MVLILHNNFCPEKILLAFNWILMFPISLFWFLNNYFKQLITFFFFLSLSDHVFINCSIDMALVANWFTKDVYSCCFCTAHVVFIQTISFRVRCFNCLNLFFQLHMSQSQNISPVWLCINLIFSSFFFINFKF